MNEPGVCVGVRGCVGVSVCVSVCVGGGRAHAAYEFGEAAMTAMTVSLWASR